MALHKDDNFIHGASSHPGWVYSRGISAPRRVFPFLLLLSSRIIIIIGSSADVVEEGDDLRCDLLCSFHRQPVPAAIDLFKHSTQFKPKNIGGTKIHPLDVSPSLPASGMSW